MIRVALIDADIPAYQASSNSQVVSPFDPDKKVRATDIEKAKREVDEYINKAIDATKADEVIVAITDRGNEFRKKLYPGYKAKRKPTKPALLFEVLDYLKSDWPSYVRPQLEADDVLGILSTHPTLKNVAGKERIIVSEDKDLRCIPGLLFNPGKPSRGVEQIGELEADKFFLVQALVGDSTDCYPGCRSVGPKSAYVAGVNAAETTSDAWIVVERAFESKGFTRDDALLQARLARILRWTDYDYKKKAPILWEPPE